ncbi:MAG: 50S ribosomal protein L28 [Thermoflavifilum sp.]|nr:50S ribosomal protein L28 [Thermoflavifilum sp.]MCL6513319.1 50S ribosomal protein L28 [Alicyclobacillus sp.]
MAQRCDICGREPKTGHKISHSHILTKRRFMPNLQRVRVVVNGTVKRMRVCTRCLKAGKVTRAV